MDHMPTVFISMPECPAKMLELLEKQKFLSFSHKLEICYSAHFAVLTFKRWSGKTKMPYSEFGKHLATADALVCESETIDANLLNNGISVEPFILLFQNSLHVSAFSSKPQSYWNDVGWL